MVRVIKPPQPLDMAAAERAVFLAGSIEMGRAVNWQAQVEWALQSYEVVILNPRRDDWDPSWAQRIDNAPFREQVEWELQAQEEADLILMYFAPETQAPISLLELGLFARNGKMIVCCPAGYWRKGNVDIVCRRYDVPTVDSLDDLIGAAQARLSDRPSAR